MMCQRHQVDRPGLSFLSLLHEAFRLHVIKRNQGVTQPTPAPGDTTTGT